METEYGQNRKYFHTVRFSLEGHNGLRERSAPYPIRRSGTNPYARQATPSHRSRPRRQNRVADPVYGGEEVGLSFSICDDFLTRCQ